MWATVLKCAVLIFFVSFADSKSVRLLSKGNETIYGNGFIHHIAKYKLLPEISPPHNIEDISKNEIVVLPNSDHNKDTDSEVFKNSEVEAESNKTVESLAINEKSDDYVNGKNEVNTNKSNETINNEEVILAYIENGTESKTSPDVNSRTSEQLTADYDPKLITNTEETKPTKELRRSKTAFASIVDGPHEELTGFETKVPCNNAQFLLKVLTVMLPLLRNEVPASTRTSYILHVLKDLLRSSPEAAYDYEIMYKINDLLATIEKHYYTMNSLRKSENDIKNDERNINDLIHLDTADTNGLKAKIVFQYEVPQLVNPDCTAELLTIVKVVQNAIKRLVDNPLCNSNVSPNLPILLEVEKHLANPSLYSYDQKPMPLKLQKEKVLPPHNYHLLDLDDFPKNSLPDYELEAPEINNYYDKLPYQQKLPENLEIPKNGPFYTYPKYSDEKDNSYSPYQNDVTSDIFQIINDIKDQPKNVPVRPQPYKFIPGSTYDLIFPKYKKDIISLLPHNVIGIEAIPIQKNSYDFVPKDDVPLRPWPVPKKNGYLELYFPESVNIPSPRPSPPLEINGDYNSAEIQFAPYKQRKPDKKPWFVIDGSPNIADIPLNEYSYDSSSYFMPYAEKPNKHVILSQTLSPSIKKLYVPNLSTNPDREPSLYPPYWDIQNQKKTNIVTELPEMKLKYKNGYHQRPWWAIVKEQTETLPDYHYPDDDNVIVEPDVPNTNSFYTSNEERILIPDLITKYPTESGIEYVNPKITLPYTIFDIDAPLPGFNDLENDEPKLLNHNSIPNKILPQSNLVPDNKILLIIKDNIQVMEQKIPQGQLSTEVRNMIQNIKHLMDLKQITIEEYVNIINQYQILIEYLKHLNISTSIMKELLLSMTNLDKLDLQTGKSQVVELTFLVKRPKPLIYQPYYYIKYRLPYSAFLMRVDKLLSENPHLKWNPAQLYKVLISMSKVAETSPDLEKYGEEDILRLTFDKGTLVGAKVIKGADIDVYNALDGLKYMNSDMSVDDVFKMIKKLDTKLKHTAQGLVLENSNIPAFNVGSQPDHIHIIKLKKQPLIQKITKITTNKHAADNILGDVFQRLNILRSDITAQNPKQKIASLEKEIYKTNDGAPLIGRLKDTHDVNQLYDNYVPTNDVKTDSKNYLPENYLKVFEDLTYHNENDGGKLYKSRVNQINEWADQYLNPKKAARWDETINMYNKNQTLPKKTAWLGATINAYDAKPNLPKETSWWGETINAYDKTPSLAKETAWRGETINPYEKKTSFPKENAWWGETINAYNKKPSFPEESNRWSETINTYYKKPSLSKESAWWGEIINAYDKKPNLPEKSTWWSETINTYDKKPNLSKESAWWGETINAYDKKPSLPEESTWWSETINPYDKKPSLPKESTWWSETINKYDKKPSLPKESAWWGQTINVYDKTPSLPKETETINAYDEKPSLPKESAWWGQTINVYDKTPSLPKETETINAYDEKPSLPKESAWWGQTINVYDKKPSLPKDTAWSGETINAFDKKPSLPEGSTWWSETINTYDKKPSLPKESAWWRQTINVYDKTPSLPKETAWWGEINTYNKKPSSFKPHTADFDFELFKSKNRSTDLADDSTSLGANNLMKQLHPITKAKLIEASRDGRKSNDSKTQKYYDSVHPKTSSSSSSSNVLVEHSKTYTNGNLVEHSKTYLVDKPDVIQQDNKTPVIYNVNHLQSFIDNPYTSHGIDANHIKDSTLTNHAMVAQTLSKGNVLADYYDTVNRPNYQNINLHQAYLGVNPYMYNQHFNLGQNIGSIGLNHLQYFIDNPYTSHGIDANHIKDSTLTNHAMVAQTLSKGNVLADYYDTVNGPNYQNINLQQAYLGVNPYMYNQHFNLGQNIGSIGLNHLQSFIDNPYTSHGIDANHIKDSTLTNHAMVAQTLSNGNVLADYYDTVNRPNYQNINLQQAYLGVNPYMYNQHFNLGQNIGSIGLNHQNFHPNNMMNLKFRYLIHNRLPLLYQFNRLPRIHTRQIIRYNRLPLIYQFNRMPRLLTRQIIG